MMILTPTAEHGKMQEFVECEERGLTHVTILIHSHGQILGKNVTI